MLALKPRGRSVFLSHNKRQKPWVRLVVAQWRKLGLEVFFDEDSILPGEDVVSALERGIAGSDHVVLILSAASLQSRWVAMEIAMTVIEDPDARDCHLIPVLVERIDLRTVRPTIRRLNIIDLTDDHSRDERYRYLLTSLGLDSSNLPLPPPFDSDPSHVSIKDEGSHTSVNDGGIRTITTTERLGLELVIRGKLDEFTPEKKARLFEAIQALLETDSELHIRNIRPGSIILTLDLNPTEAERLYWAVQRGALKDFGVMDARLLEEDAPGVFDQKAKQWQQGPRGRTSTQHPDHREERDQSELQLWREVLLRNVPLVSLPRDGVLPLSFAQQRLWFINKLDPNAGAYNTPAALRIRRDVNAEIMHRSLEEVVRRHEALRTTFTDTAGEPAQIIHNSAPFGWEEKDLRGVPSPECEVELWHRAHEEAVRPFDLASGPLLRATLLRLKRRDCVLLLTMHQIVSDGWSLDVLFRETFGLYEAFSRGEVPRLPELPVQYADFAAWQRAWLDGEILKAQLDYWREHLAGAPPVLEIPTDHPRRAVLSAHSAYISFSVSAETTCMLRELGRNEGATLYMILLAGWQALLGRYAGEENVVVGGLVAGRPWPEVEVLIGRFVNTLVLRTNLSGDPTVRGLLRRVREGLLSAFSHQDLPFERLVEELAPKRSLAHTPIFQVLFTMENRDRQRLPLRVGQTGIERLEVDTGFMQFDLALSLAEDGDELEGELEYRTDLFDSETVWRMTEHLSVILRALAADHGRHISELEWMTSAERQQVLVEWNRPRMVSLDRLVHHLVSEQTARTPNAIAVRYGSQEVSYSDLDLRSNRLAHYLRGRGVGPETLVGVCTDPSPELLVAMLGILKAGGACVQLDPAYSTKHLDFALRDSGAPLLVTQSFLVERFSNASAATVQLDTEGHLIARESAASLESGATPDHLAYVIYTSGSNGTRDAIRIEHRNLTNTLLCVEQAIGFGTRDEMLVLTSFTSDRSLFESLLPLLSGGTVRIVPRDEILEVAVLAREIAAATMLYTAPTLMRQVVACVRETNGTLPSLRSAFLSAEAVPPDLLHEVRKVFPAIEMCLLHGPREVSIVFVTHLLSTEEGQPLLSKPIGNATLYVLDPTGQPTPVGIPGELFIGGASVARDYLGRPKLTAEKMVPDPFSSEFGARMFRTGDRVRWHVDGMLEEQGRFDHHVKIHGFRIEPGEIEVALLTHAAVREVAVVVREDAPGVRRLVAYVVAAEGAPLSGVDLRKHLEETLPEFMIPSAYIWLDGLPLTPSGKLDRRALPIPRDQFSKEFVEPRTTTEEF